ncbi:MAG: type II toxin-antitoxin system RelE/ParE family toxin [Gammaproteobacteria bacterium]
MIEVREYIDPAGRSPFEKWFSGLEASAAAKITVALVRLERGNRSNVKGVGGGVLEIKIDYGPGYRVYFGKDGEHLVILLGGGTKKRQSADVETARRLWRDYKAQKKVELWH